MALSSQSSDDEAPEAVTFNTLKKTVKGEEAAVQKHRAAEKQKRKEKNRIRDAALKERAAKTKGDAKKDVQSEEEKDGAGPSELELRMARAMKEAAAESGEEDDDEEMEGDEESEQPSDEDDSEEEDSDEGMATQENPDYLPDHLFESAFSQNPPVASSSKKLLSSSKRKATEEQSLKRRKRSRKSNKDIVVGSRTIRTLSAVFEAPALRPTRRVNVFLKRSLNVNGSDKHAKTKGWERRAANIGVMRRSGPAAHFVRDV